MNSLTNLDVTEMKGTLHQINSVLESAKNNMPKKDVLKSSENLIRLVDFLDSKRDSVNADEKFHFRHLRKILSDCEKYERNLQGSDVVWAKTPEEFMRSIEKKQVKGLCLADLKLKKQGAKNKLQEFVSNAQKDKSLDEVSDERIQMITNTLSTLISNKENYHFIEYTNGFFCEEVLSEYRKHLLNLIKNKTGEDNPEVFTVERMQ